MPTIWTTTEKRDIQTFIASAPDENPWVHGQPEPECIEVVPYDAHWPHLFATQSQRIAAALGDIALIIAHVGSTAVPHLAAKPVIDIDLIVPNPHLEVQYVPALTELGYELTIREPSWYQHRMLRLAQPRVNLHVFGPHCPEHWRHQLFKQWLIQHPEDCARYAEAKMQSRHHVATVAAYNQKKQQIVREIYQKLFAALD